MANPTVSLLLQEYPATSKKTALFKSTMVFKLWFFVYGSGCDVSPVGFNISCLGIWFCVGGGS
jgi:hypothetical protein